MFRDDVGLKNSNVIFIQWLNIHSKLAQHYYTECSCSLLDYFSHVGT